AVGRVDGVNQLRIGPRQVRGRVDRQIEGGWGQAVFQHLEARPGPGRGLAGGTGRAGEQAGNPGTGGHGKSPRRAGWPAVHRYGNARGAETGRPGAAGPVRGLLGGTPSPAAVVSSVVAYLPLSGGTSNTSPQRPQGTPGGGGAGFLAHTWVMRGITASTV